jgi:hypothetical protein
MTMMMGVNMLMAGRFLAQAVYRAARRAGDCACCALCGVHFLWPLTDWPSEADAPVARFTAFAPLSLTSALSGDRSFAQDHGVVVCFGQDDGAECFAHDDGVVVRVASDDSVLSVT